MRPVELSWVGGEHEFALPLGQLRALQDACDAGPEHVFNRLRTGQWRVNDLFDTLRLGLIGGGMDGKAAAQLVLTLIEQHGLAELKLTAISVLQHALFQPEDDPVGKTAGAEVTPPENGDSQGSTETEPS